MKISISQSFQRILISGLPLPFRLADSPRKGIWNMSFSLNLGKMERENKSGSPCRRQDQRNPHSPLYPPMPPGGEGRCSYMRTALSRDWGSGVPPNQKCELSKKSKASPRLLHLGTPDGSGLPGLTHSAWSHPSSIRTHTGDKILPASLKVTWPPILAHKLLAGIPVKQVGICLQVKDPNQGSQMGQWKRN